MHLSNQLLYGFRFLGIFLLAFFYQMLVIKETEHWFKTLTTLTMKYNDAMDHKNK